MKSTLATTLGNAGRRALLIFVFLYGITGASAQTLSTTPAPSPTPTPSLERKFFKNILHDQLAIWTSPLRLRGRDAQWLAPLSLTTAALIATDRRTAGSLDDNQTRLDVSHGISQIGATYTTAGIAATFYLVGRAKGNARARETGLLGEEAILNGQLVSVGLKAITQRPRPLEGDRRGRFFDGGDSFPSGHAISAWSLATIIDQEYGRHHSLVRVGAYGLATAVSLSRFTGSKHYLSDVLVGSAIGYGIGRYIYHKHHDPSLDEPDGQGAHSLKSRLFPVIAPRYDRQVHSYGMTLAWNF